MLESFEAYFGLKDEGVNLIKSLENVPCHSLNILKAKIMSCKGRIFFFGNGGFYDNARWMAQVCRRLGIKAKTPGVEEDYILTINSSEYSDIFSEGLKFDELNSKDLVIGISGSGNSKNVIKAFRYALGIKAAVFALGGRDGGEMIKEIGADNCLIVQNQCMEAIEDLHNFIWLIVIESIRLKVKNLDIKQSFVSRLMDFTGKSNLNQLSSMTEKMIGTIKSGGRTFILGLGIGANHFRADMGRGATNALPIRGLSCPEVFTMNSLQATANDDGTDFLIVDGLVKYNPDSNDFGILCDSGHSAVKLSEDLLRARNVPYTKIGEGGLDTSMFKAEYFDFPVTMAGHSCGYVIRRELLKEFEIKPLVNDLEFKDAKKKLTDRETVSLENKLIAEGTLSKSEAITFCYGQVFAVKSKNKYQREFY